jgi:hypothetical protein
MKLGENLHTNLIRTARISEQVGLDEPLYHEVWSALDIFFLGLEADLLERLRRQL